MTNGQGGLQTTVPDTFVSPPLTDPMFARQQFDRALYHASRMKLPNRPNRNYPREAYRQTHKSIGFLKRKPRDADG